MFPVTRNQKYDFAGQSYASVYPNLHRYPATMLPQIGIEILRELGIQSGKMLDPYCGSGSSFIAGLDQGVQEMFGFDINPLAILISQARFTHINMDEARQTKMSLRNDVFEFVKDEERLKDLPLPQYFNVNFWFSPNVLQQLTVLRHFLQAIENEAIRRLFWVAFSETLRECSLTRNDEFKLYRMKAEDALRFNPDALGVFFEKLNRVLDIYEHCYLPKLNGAKIAVDYKEFPKKENYFDVVLTSPPYGDSRTTVAYGQFSHFANEWMGISHARKIDQMLMGGKTGKYLYSNGIIADSVREIAAQDAKRGLEVSAFYFDLADSIRNVAHSVRPGGKAIYVVGNRRVKGVQLPTDQFIAEQFCANGFGHLITYERQISNKVMPAQNSPTNQTGVKMGTMTQEFIVVCEKR